MYTLRCNKEHCLEMDLRQRGERKSVKHTKRTKGGDPFSSLGFASPGEVKVGVDRMFAINELYNASPSFQAARAILQGQLLSSGIRLQRKGEDVELAESFSRHLEAVWLPFAKSVIDHFLMFGFCVVCIDEEDEEPFASLSGAMHASDDISSGSLRSRKRPADVVSQLTRNAKRDANLIPLVPSLGTYEVGWVMSGRGGYKRRYRVFNTTEASAYAEDPEAAVFFKQHPDAAGNITSPVAAVFDSASFVSALVELALNAEVVRARQMVVTQPVQKTQGSQVLDASNMFFDSESRAIQSAATGEEGESQAANLSIAVQACEMINRMQTTVQDRAGAGADRRATHVPPEIPPRLFTIPERQQVVPNLKAPEARTDLVDLMRVVNEHIAASMGVPASVIVRNRTRTGMNPLHAQRSHPCPLRARSLRASSPAIQCKSTACLQPFSLCHKDDASRV